MEFENDSGGLEINEGNSSERISLENQTDPSPPPALPEFNTIVPQDYSDKEWVQNIKDIPTMFKMIEDQRTALAKRPASIPFDDATKEEWDAFNKSFGVPEKPDEYEFGEPPEGLERNEKFENGIRDLFQKAGVSKRQAKVLDAGWSEMMKEMATEGQNSADFSDAEFDKMTATLFGEREQEVLANSRTILAKFSADLPKEYDGVLDSIPNKGLIAIAHALDKIKQEYISEGGLPDDLGAAPTPMSQDEVRAKGRELMASEAYQNPFHKEHEKVKAQVEALYNPKR